MRRTLLTQSQVSVVVSSGISKSHRNHNPLNRTANPESLVGIFTLFLFLSGYVLQQRTVTGLQEAIKPRIPPPPPSLAIQQDQQQPLSSSELQPSRFFSSRNDGGHVAYTDFSKARQDTSASVKWNRLAHIQLVSDHHDVCNAIMVLAELHRLKSPARRLLLFPQAWAAEKKAGKGETLDPFLDSSRRLMRMAARRYGVELRPISPVITSPAAEGGAGDLYSLVSAYALTDFDRILQIETPGLLMDASPLDAVLAFTEAAPFAMLHDTTEGDGVHSEDLFLLQPSAQAHTELKKQIATYPKFNDTILSTAFSDPLFLSAIFSDSGTSTLIRSIGMLHSPPPAPLDSPNPKSAFNATAFLSNVAYMRFSDPKLPGPEYDVPWSDKRDARPKNKDADWTWTKMYGQFAQKRLEICGLDLETWRP